MIETLPPGLRRAVSPYTGIVGSLEECLGPTSEPRLFQAACELGALEGTAPVDVLGRFGRRIGLAFQLLDDVLDVSGPAERTGKHRGTDLLDGTVTLPLILARERNPALRSLDLRAVRTPAHAERLCDAIACGAVALGIAKRMKKAFRACVCNPEILSDTQA